MLLVGSGREQAVGVSLIIGLEVEQVYPSRVLGKNNALGLAFTTPVVQGLEREKQLPQWLFLPTNTNFLHCTFQRFGLLSGSPLLPVPGK